MTRDEAQALAEELVLRLARHSYRGRGLGLEGIRHTFLGGISSHHSVMQNRGQMMTNGVVMLAACAIELLRETFAALPDTADEIRAQHGLPEIGRPS